MSDKAENRKFIKQLTAVALPVALQSLLTSLVSASDAMMLGLLDQNSLSAISLATQVQFVLTLFQAAFMIGASVLAAQYWGIQDSETVEKVLGLSLRCSIPVSGIFFLAGLIFPGQLMRCFTSDPALTALGIPYLRIVSVSFLMTGISQMVLNIMKNSGRVRRSAVYGSAAVVLNIVLNLILIFGLAGAPRMGIAGAALATVIARAAELALCLFENVLEHRRERNGQRGLPRDDIDDIADTDSEVLRPAVRMRLEYILHADPQLRRSYLHHMALVLANEIAWGGGFTMFSVIMGHLGSVVVASNSISSILKNILTCTCTGLGAGSAILIGNLLGAGELEKAKDYSRRLIRASLVLGAAAGALLLLLTPLVLRLSGSLTMQAREYLKYMMFISVLIEGTFCAGGDTRFGFLCDLVNMWIVILPIAALAAFVWHWPVMAVYFVLHLDEIGKIPVEIAHYRTYRWSNNLTGRTKE